MKKRRMVLAFVRKVAEAHGGDVMYYLALLESLDGSDPVMAELLCREAGNAARKAVHAAAEYLDHGGAV